jgi:hypothetical protein
MVGKGAVRYGRLRRQVVEPDGLQWWRDILYLNLSNIEYNELGKSWPRKIAETICHCDPSLDVEKATELAWALREACHG